MSTRARQSETFDEVAEIYDRARPGYPAQLVEDVIAATGIPPAGRILEVGCGTGQATRPFAERGYRMLCLEPGSNLARIAAANLRAHANVRVARESFEAWKLEPAAFDLLISAQAFHWIAPEVRFEKAADALRPKGFIALFWNTPLPDESALGAAIQAAYAAHAPGLVARLPGTTRSGEPPSAEIAASGRFAPVSVKLHPWRKTYARNLYLELLQTQSDHRLLPERQRAALLDAIGDVIERHGGAVDVHTVARLYLAQRV